MDVIATFDGERFALAASERMAAQGITREELHFRTRISHHTLHRLFIKYNVKKIDVIWTVAAALDLNLALFITVVTRP